MVSSGVPLLIFVSAPLSQCRTLVPHFISVTGSFHDSSDGHFVICLEKSFPVDTGLVPVRIGSSALNFRRLARLMSH